MEEREGAESLPDSGIRTYVLRAGRMTEGQRAALERLGPRFVIPCDGESPIDLASAFGNEGAVVMEIGFGMGQATWQIARDRPEVNFLGVEVHSPGVGKLLLDIERENLENLRIINRDVVEVLEKFIPGPSLAGYHIFYPDPWPKKRHNKRRLIRDGLSELLASRLARGAYLYFVTDIPEYAAQALEVLTRTPGLKNRFEGFAPRQEWRPETKFEARARGEGRETMELYFLKT
jgi:tRNA (guanine-N7-)-methyltransferase